MKYYYSHSKNLMDFMKNNNEYNEDNIYNFIKAINDFIYYEIRTHYFLFKFKNIPIMLYKYGMV